MDEALKTSEFFLLIILFTLISHVSFSQKRSVEILDEGYYVVVAAYASSQEKYAEIFKEKLEKEGYSSSYGYTPIKKMYFVYVHYDRNFRSSLEEMRKMRQKEEFNDAWVYIMGNYEAPATPDVKEKIEVTGIVEESKHQPDTSRSHKGDTSFVKRTEKEDPSLRQLEEKVIFQEKQKSEKGKQETLNDYLTFLNLYNASNYHDVSGDVQVVDPVRASLLDVVESGSYVILPDPNNRSGDILLICDVFGYRKMQKKINYYDPAATATDDDVQIIADVFVVNFDLIRYHVGDIATMFHVYFYKDAAIMQPESKYELNQLLEMMKENPHYKIRIHGHTNGKNPGPIIYPGEDNNLFSLNDDNKTGFGTAKKLSKERASLIKEYLVQNDIEPDRIEIKAWGGRRMLYDKHSSQAYKNVRVEIEIIEE